MTKRRKKRGKVKKKLKVRITLKLEKLRQAGKMEHFVHCVKRKKEREREKKNVFENEFLVRE